MKPLLETNLPELLEIELLYKGKVRDTYGLTPKELLFIATDRVSAFDVVMPNGVPDKGKVLCQLSAFWFDKVKHIIPNHMIKLVNDASELDSYLGRDVRSRFRFPDYLAGRSMVVIPYHRMGTSKYAQYGMAYPLDGLEPPSQTEMQKLKSIVENFGLQEMTGSV